MGVSGWKMTEKLSRVEKFFKKKKKKKKKSKEILAKLI